MENRFFELSNGSSGLLARQSGSNRFESHGQSNALSNNWARSLSAAQRVLVVLIENGGVDLRIPEAVDALINSIPGSGLIPDSVKKKIRDLISDEINKPLKKSARNCSKAPSCSATGMPRPSQVCTVMSSSCRTAPRPTTT